MKKHVKKSRLLAILLAILVVLVIGLATYLLQSKISPRAEGEVASLQLAPSSDVYTVGTSFDVQVNVNPGGQTISGNDVILFYPTDLLEAQTATLNTTSFPSGKAIIDAANHKIIMTANVETGSSYAGGIAQVGTVRFKALAAGQALVTFDFTLGNTSDSNVTTLDENGMPKDILGSVNTGDYTLQAAVTPTCGNATCDVDETCTTCAQDCGVCPTPLPVCGDGICNGSDTCSNCSNDCGGCPPPPDEGAKCGDKVCSSTESCSSCSTDCGVCATPKPSPTPTPTPRVSSVAIVKSPTAQPSSVVTSTPTATPTPTQPIASFSPVYPISFTSPSSSPESKTGGFKITARWLYVVIPLIVIILAFVFYSYYSKPKSKEETDDFDILND